MDAKKRQKIVYSLFVLAVIYGVYNLVFNPMGNSVAPRISAPLPALTRQEIPPKAINIEKYSSLAWGQDPFYRPKIGPTQKAPARHPTWVLNGILYDEVKPSAIINKKIVSVGDSVEAAKILEITKSKVVLQVDGGNNISLTMSKEES